MSLIGSTVGQQHLLQYFATRFGCNFFARALHHTLVVPQLYTSYSVSNFTSRKKWRQTHCGRMSQACSGSSKAAYGCKDNAGTYLTRLLSDQSIKVRDVERVKQKLEQLIEGGPQKLHIVSDFDGTLTQYWVNGVRSTTSHAIVTSSSFVPQKLKDSTQELYERYYPIEVSHSMTPAEKFPHMEEWWRKVHEVLVDGNMKRDDIRRMVQETPVLWRSGVPALMTACAAVDIPVLVFSAGLADVILEVLKDSELMLPNVHVISNKMIFEPDPPHTCVGFDEPVIHVFNKNESAIAANSDYFAEVSHRPNVLLMGDSLGDLKMSEGMKHDVCLTVGFLNHDIDLLYPSYSAHFDIVVLNDGAVQIVSDLLDSMHKCDSDVDAGVVSQLT